MGAQAHQIAEASLFSPKQYWRASALLCSLLLGLPGDSNTFMAAATALRWAAPDLASLSRAVTAFCYAAWALQ